MWKKENPLEQQPSSPGLPSGPEHKAPTVQPKAERPISEGRSQGYSSLGRDVATRKEPANLEPTVISAHTTFSGEISGQADIKLFGNFQGSIESPKCVLTVESSGYAKANINAKNVVIHGKLIGNVTGLDSVHLVSTGTVEGDIRAANVILDKGATFNGSIEMIRDNKESTGDSATSKQSPASVKTKPAAVGKPVQSS